MLPGHMTSPVRIVIIIIIIIIIIPELPRKIMSIPATDRISFLSPKLPEGHVILTEPTIQYSVLQYKLTVLFSLNLQMVYSH